MADFAPDGSPRSVGILGVFGTGNLGNEASLSTIIQHLQARCPGAAIYVLSLNLTDTRARYGVNALSAEPLKPKAERSTAARRAASRTLDAEQSLVSRVKGLLERSPRITAVGRGILNAPRALREAGREARFFWRSWGTLRRTDLFIVGGGGMLTDDVGGPWELPLFVFKWVLLAKLAGARIAFVSVGAGPLTTAVGRFLVKCSLRLASYQSFRDARSTRLLASINAPGEHLLYPDVAFSLRVPVEPAPAKRKKPI